MQGRTSARVAAVLLSVVLLMALVTPAGVLAAAPRDDLTIVAWKTGFTVNEGAIAPAGSGAPCPFTQAAVGPVSH